MSSPAFVIGNLTRNPQLSRTSGATTVVNLTLAENSRRLVEGEWVDGPTTFWDRGPGPRAGWWPAHGDDGEQAADRPANARRWRHDH